MGTAKIVQQRNPEKKAAFLEAVRSNGGMVLAAADSVGLSRKTMYDWRRADPEFKAAWEQAILDSTIVLEQEAIRRATKGVTEDVYHKGEVVGQQIRYSDNLLMFTMKAREPDKYRDRSEVKHTGEVVIKSMTDEQIDATIAKLLERLK